MRSTLRTMALAVALAIGGLAMMHAPAWAGCGGGGGGNRAYGGGHTFNAGYAGGGYGRGGSCAAGCGMTGMAMSGMLMGAHVPAPAAYAPTAHPLAPPQPVAGAQYTCPMHPMVVSATPGSCPYCQMAFQRR